MWTSSIPAAFFIALVSGACHNYERDYYEELGCKPESEDKEGCPTSYDCSELSGRSKDNCHYKGNKYDEGQKVETNSASSCLVECRCAQSYSGNKMAFSCVSVECPELFIGPPSEGCYRTYEHDKCCHVDELCGDTAEQKTSKPVCKYKDDTFQVGQKFYPDEEPCMQCICQPGYNGTLVEPFCRKIRCNLELVSGFRIAEGCVPVYYGENDCCPIDWRCPEKSDSVASSSLARNSSGSSEPGKTCKFGELTMKVGDKLSPSPEHHAETECICRVPPHPVCIQKMRE